MTEPVSSVAPLTSRAPPTSRRRLALRLRRLLVSASWHPFVVLVLWLEGEGDDRHLVTWLMSMVLMLTWPVVVIHNVTRGRPPRWGRALHGGVGLLNVVLLMWTAVYVMFAGGSYDRSWAILLIGVFASASLFVAVLVCKRQRMSVTFVAACVSTVAALFVTIVIATTIEGRPWRRYLPEAVVVEAPLVDDKPVVVPLPPTPPPVPTHVVAPSPPTFQFGALTSFAYGAESDCSGAIVDADGRVWLVAGSSSPCDWLVTLDGTEVCAQEREDGALLVEGRPDVRLSLLRRGKRVETTVDFMKHNRQPATLRVDSSSRAVTIHVFCRADDESEDEPSVAPVIRGVAR